MTPCASSSGRPAWSTSAAAASRIPRAARRAWSSEGVSAGGRRSGWRSTAAFVAARQVKDLLLEHVRGGGTVVLTTHILEVAERLAQRIGIIEHGRLIAEGTLAELRGQTDADTLEDVFLQLTGQP